MKTSLELPESLRKEAKLLAAKSGKGIGEVIVYWATLGKDIAKKTKVSPGKRSFKPLDLGKPVIETVSRSNIYDKLEDKDDWLR